VCIVGTRISTLDARDVLPVEIVLNCTACLKFDLQIGHPEYYSGKTYEQLETELAKHQYEYHYSDGLAPVSDILAV
jgi:hypothetical protein